MKSILLAAACGAACLPGSLQAGPVTERAWLAGATIEADRGPTIVPALDASPWSSATFAASEDSTWARQALRVLTLRDYNTRIVLLGTTLLGGSAGLVGVFMLLRRRSLVGDVVSHASLPGIAIAFLLLECLEAGSGKSLAALLSGALVSGLCGILSVKLLLRCTRLKEDAALAIVLSVFFGLGIALLTAIQNIPSGNAAGLNQFIFGKAAAMVATDVWLTAGIATAVVLTFALLFKEFAVMSFDEPFATAQGWPVFKLDFVLMALVTVVTINGLQSVGLLLVVAMLIIPAAAARFWTDDLRRMALFAGSLGALSAAVGVALSALFPRLAAGAVIVLSGTGFFVVSLLFGLRRGVIVRLAAFRRLRMSVGRQHVLRGVFELLEPQIASNSELPDALTHHVAPVDELRSMRSWSPREFKKMLARSKREGLVADTGDSGLRLTQRGAEEACREVRNHRLWELYLIEHADVAPSHVDRDADDIEHLLGTDVVTRLNQLMSVRYPHRTVPPSPHRIEPTRGT